jgi:hypothetical protein
MHATLKSGAYVESYDSLQACQVDFHRCGNLQVTCHWCILSSELANPNVDRMQGGISDILLTGFCQLATSTEGHLRPKGA